jgi:hypothetical protein
MSYMIIRTIDGKFMEVNKYDFSNDKTYYKHIMEKVFRFISSPEKPQSYSTYLIQKIIN